MEIRLYSFSKRKNSTKQPLTTDLITTLSGELKEACSVLMPTIKIEVPTGVDLFTDAINYAYIPAFGRRYWISNINLIADKIAELHLTVDVLGSYKSIIGNSTQFVVRSAAVKNDYLPDETYPVSANSVTFEEDLSLPWDMLDPGNITEGYYVVGMQTADPNAIGSVAYFVLDQTAFQTLRNILMSNVNYTNMSFSEIEQPLYKSLFNPFQYLVSCVWFPFQPAVGQYSITGFMLGFFPITGIPAGHMWALSDTCQEVTSSSLSTVNHPQISEGTYYNTAPYMRRKLLVQPFGEIPLDSSKILDINHVLKVKTWVDFVTGDCMLRVIDTANADTVVGSASGKLGVPVQMSQSTQDIIGMGMGALAAGAGAVSLIGSGASMAMGAGAGNAGAVIGSQGGITSGLTQVAAGIANAANAYAPVVSSNGTNGSLLNTVTPGLYEVQYFLTPAHDNVRFGSPLMESRKINTLTANGGFVKCQNAHISAAGFYDEEIAGIEAYMNAGFYYE